MKARTPASEQAVQISNQTNKVKKTYTGPLQLSTTFLKKNRQFVEIIYSELSQEILKKQKGFNHKY